VEARAESGSPKIDSYTCLDLKPGPLHSIARPHPRVSAAALAAGHEDHGGPGERAVYHAGYYGAFVLDPDGYFLTLISLLEALSRAGSVGVPRLSGLFGVVPLLGPAVTRRQQPKGTLESLRSPAMRRRQ
jgi:hypothetical protein